MSRVLDRLFVAATGTAAALACLLFFGIVAVIAGRALPALEPSFLSFGEDGVGYQLAGTIILLLTSLAVSTPLAVAVALTRSVYVADAAWRRRIDLALYTLNGVPSILFGIFGLILFGHLLGWGKSWLAGGALLGVMILPTVTVALVERLDAVPRRYVTAATGLGLGTSAVIWSVLLPQARGGLVSGSLLGLARAAGETAPILFTAAVFSGVTLPTGVRESPVLALPYHIFVLAQDSFDPAAGGALWGSALVLIAVVLALSLAALPLRLRQHQEARHG